VIGLATIIAIAGVDSLPSASRVIPLAVVAVGGHGIGRRLFLRLPTRAYEPVVLGAALVAGLAGVTAVLVGSFF